MKKIPSTYDKALRINLDPKIYGTFAEIGAGQEVANCFFRTSATAGTVAKSISAYDMTMSDAIYGKGKRYVSRDRLKAMLDHEYSVLTERLTESRGEESTFFSFCNTVRARGYKDTGECHGWLGIRFQQKPMKDACDIIIHVRLLDKENVDQMEALGVIGTNLIYAAFYHMDNLENFVLSLVDNIGEGRVEVDMLKFLGKGCEMIDNRLCALQLVESGLTDSTMFLPDGEVVQPAEALYKTPVVLLRGSFNPVTNLHMDMLKQTGDVFQPRLDDKQQGRMIEVCEISTNNLLRGESGVDHTHFLDRADALQALGKTVLISSCPEFHRVASILRRYTTCPIAISLSIGLLHELFKEKWSENLEGGILESFGRLFKNKLSLYVYPWQNRQSGELVTAENFKVEEQLKNLYAHFLENKLINSVECSDLTLLQKTGRDLKVMIESGDEDWRNWVPEEGYQSAMSVLTNE